MPKKISNQKHLNLPPGQGGTEEGVNLIPKGGWVYDQGEDVIIFVQNDNIIQTYLPSPLRKQGSISDNRGWIPASAGMTNLEIDHSETRKIFIRNGTHLRWYGLCDKAISSSLEFVVEEGSTCEVRMLLLSRENRQDITCLGKIVGPNAEVNIHILSLVAEGGDITLNGTVSIAKNCTKTRGHILEENIFLGSKGAVRGIPSLLIHCDDVEASHAARIERIFDEKLHYLRAHGIPRDDASVMMVEGKVRKLFEAAQVDVDGILERVKGMFIVTKGTRKGRKSTT